MVVVLTIPNNPTSHGGYLLTGERKVESIPVLKRMSIPLISFVEEKGGLGYALVRMSDCAMRWSCRFGYRRPGNNEKSREGLEDENASPQRAFEAPT